MHEKFGNNDTGQHAEHAPSHEADPLFQAYVSIARYERTAAMRALTGQFAHQMRNPLAAIQTACINLRCELDDSEQRARLDLALGAIDGLMNTISRNLHGVSETPEQSQEVEAVNEVREISCLYSASCPQSPLLQVGGQPIHCRLPRHGLRVAIYSLIDHLMRACKPVTAKAVIAQELGQLRLYFMGWSDAAPEYPVTEDQWPMALTAETGTLELLVAEQFARGLGGQLSRTMAGDASLILTLELPCIPAGD